jgi:hypothetical protein
MDCCPGGLFKNDGNIYWVGFLLQRDCFGIVGCLLDLDRVDNDDLTGPGESAALNYRGDFGSG